MQNSIHALFNNQTIERLCSKIIVSSEQEKNAVEWINLLELHSLGREKSNYIRFAIIVLQNILGYPIKEDFTFEEGNVEFSFKNPSYQKGICIEVKGTSTKDLFSSHRA